MTGYVVLLVLLAAACLAAYYFAQVAFMARKDADFEHKRYLLAAERLATQAAEFRNMEAARHALEKDLAHLRSGPPADRLDAGLDVLRDVSAKTGAAPRAPAPGLADLGSAAGRDRT